MIFKLHLENSHFFKVASLPYKTMKTYFSFNEYSFLPKKYLREIDVHSPYTLGDLQIAEELQQIPTKLF